MLLCVDFCDGYCSFRVNYLVGLEKACLLVKRGLTPLTKNLSHIKVQFLKRPSTDFDKSYIFGIGTSSELSSGICHFIGVGFRNMVQWVQLHPQYSASGCR